MGVGLDGDGLGGDSSGEGGGIENGVGALRSGLRGGAPSGGTVGVSEIEGGNRGAPGAADGGTVDVDAQGT
jgi:hypothetical protein